MIMNFKNLVLDTSQTFIQKNLEPRQTTIPSFQQVPITDSQVAYAKLNKAGHRPLGRTQSAPLPLGHPMLNSATSGQHLSVHYENHELPLQQMNVHHYLKQVHFYKWFFKLFYSSLLILFFIFYI